MAKYSKGQIKQMIIAEAKRRGVPPELALAVVEQESGFNPFAISPRNKNGSRDHGLFQLNDKYHKLKNPYDALTNIRYGIGVLKQCLDQAGGDVRKALSYYNAGVNAKGEGRRQGNAYADKVLARKRMMTTSALQGTAGDSGSTIVARDEQGNPTMIAGGVNSSGAGVSASDKNANGAAAKANPMDAIRGAYDLDALQNKALDLTAIESNIPYMESIYDRAITNANVNAKNIEQEYAPQQYTPRQMNELTQQNVKDLTGIYGQSNKSNNALYDRMQNLYNQELQALQNDWRLQNQGYQLTPEQIAGTRMGISMGQSVTPATIAEMEWKAAMANKYGVPFEYVEQALNNIETQKPALYKQLITSMADIGKQSQDVSKEAITQVGKLLSEGQGNVQKTQQSSQQFIQQPRIKGVADMGLATMNAEQGMYAQRPTTAANMANQYLQAQTGITQSQIDAATKQRNADIAAQTAIREQNLKDRQFQQMLPIKREQADAYYFGNISPFSGYTPEQIANMGFVMANPQGYDYATYSQIVNPQGLTENTFNAKNPLNAGNLTDNFNRQRKALQYNQYQQQFGND